MPDLLPYYQGPLARLLDDREHRRFARELAAVRRPARALDAEICAGAQATASAMQNLAALSHLEIQLSAGDEVTAQRLGQIMQAATAGMSYRLQRLWIDG